MDSNNSTESLELHYDDLDFEQGPAPYNYLKLKYPIHSVHATQCLSVDSTTRQLEFNINTDFQTRNQPEPNPGSGKRSGKESM